MTFVVRLKSTRLEQHAREPGADVLEFFGREAEGVTENLAARDQRDSQRAAAPLMIALGAKVINNSQMTSAETSGLILAEMKKLLADRDARGMVAGHKPRW